jgi:hypothetical protein
MTLVRLVSLALVAGAFAGLGCSSSDSGSQLPSVKDGGGDTKVTPADTKPAVQDTNPGSTDTGPVDCTTQPDFKTCSDCFAGQYQAGVKPLNDILTCIFDVACFTTCDGASAGGTAPATKDACDVGTASSANCTTCQKCAQGATCKAQATACGGEPDCIALNKALQTCPTN